LIAAFSTVNRPKFGGISPSSSSRARAVPASIRSTRSRVGGTTGNPSVTPLSNQISNSSAVIARFADAIPDLSRREFPRPGGYA
jgi:hypothetical protein